MACCGMPVVVQGPPVHGESLHSEPDDSSADAGCVITMPLVCYKKRVVLDVTFTCTEADVSCAFTLKEGSFSLSKLQDAVAAVSPGPALAQRQLDSLRTVIWA